MMAKRYILAAVVIAAVTIGGYGCMGEREYRDANEGALTYMEEKYGEKFEYIKSHGWLMSTKSRGILVSCETYPGKEIYISIVKEGKKEIYRDNYMEYYFAERVSEWMVGIAKDYFDDVSFKVRIYTVQSKYAMDLTTTFEEYISREYYSVHGFFDIGETNEETIREFVSELVRRGIRFSLDIEMPLTGEWYGAQYFRGYEEVDFYYGGKRRPKDGR